MSAAEQKNHLSMFLKASAIDFVLVLVSSIALVMTVSYGFESAPALRSNPLVCAGIAVPLLLTLFAGSWSKKAVPVSAAIGVVYGVAAIAVLTALSPEQVPLVADGGLNDVAQSNFLFAVVAVVCPALVYLLSRRRLGALILMLGGILACQVVQFLYRDFVSDGNGVLLFAVLMVGLMALFMFQGYRSSMRQARFAKKTSFGAAGITSALLGTVCLLAGMAVFFGVISALGVTTPQIKPFKDYYIRPVVYYSGNYSMQIVDDPDAQTSVLSEEKSDGNINAPGGSQTIASDKDDQRESTDTTNAGSQLSLDPLDWSEAFDTVSHEQLVVAGISAAVLLLAALVAFVLFWRSRRKRRLRKIAEKPLSYRVWFLYQFLLERYRRMGIRKSETLTLMEFAMANRAAMAPLVKHAGVDFLDATLAYQRAVYDPQNVTSEDYRTLVRLYQVFYKNAYLQTNLFKWAFWRFWRL